MALDFDCLIQSCSISIFILLAAEHVFKMKSYKEHTFKYIYIALLLLFLSALITTQVIYSEPHSLANP